MANDTGDSPRLVFMGSGPFAAPTLTMLAEAYQVAGVITQPDRQTGRGRRTQRGLIAAAADQLGLPVKQPETFKDPESVNELERLCPDILVVASYGRILPRTVLALPARGALNLHPSLLPRHRGPSPVAGAILAGDDVTGVTVIEMTSRMDAGPIVAQREVAIEGDDTTESLTIRLASENAKLLVESLPGWLDTIIQARPQEEEDATYTQLLSKEMAAVQWSKPARQLRREVRAFIPWPVSHSVWPGGVLRIFASDFLAGDTAGAIPGQVVGLEPNGIIVQTGQDRLVLREVQAENARRMSAAEFVRGHPTIRHAILG
jgi:methionyl-tRNA formyltransferase